MDSAISVGFRRIEHFHATLITKAASLTAMGLDCSGMNQLSSSLTISIHSAASELKASLISIMGLSNCIDSFNLSSVKVSAIAGRLSAMHELLTITIEAGIGLAGFAGIAVVLSGDSRNWSPAEKLRIGTMLFLALFAVFGAFLCLYLLRHFEAAPASRIASGISFATLLVANFIVLKKSRTPFRQDDPTINRRLAYILWGLFMAVAIFQLMNAAGLFRDAFAAFFASLIFLLLFAAFLFVRILFVRPGMQDKPG